MMTFIHIMTCIYIYIYLFCLLLPRFEGSGRLLVTNAVYSSPSDLITISACCYRLVRTERDVALRFA